MNVMINGEPQTLEKACSIRQLLVQRGFGSSPCAVEVNRTLVPKRRHEEHVIGEGDRVEIVTLVGGG